MSSCIDIGFDSPQPMAGKVVKEVPKTLLGQYYDKEDTIIITSNYIISGGDSTELDLGEAMELREWKHYYFLNSYREDLGYWTVVVVEAKEDRLSIYTPLVQEEDKAKLERKFEVREIRNDQGNISAFIINPTTRQWKKLLNSTCYEKSNLKRIK